MKYLLSTFLPSIILASLLSTTPAKSEEVTRAITQMWCTDEVYAKGVADAGSKDINVALTHFNVVTSFPATDVRGCFFMQPHSVGFIADKIVNTFTDSTGKLINVWKTKAGVYIFMQAKDQGKDS